MNKIKQSLSKAAIILLILSLLPSFILTSAASGLRYLIEPTDVYKNVYDFNDGLALVVKQDDQIGYINKYGEEVIPFGKYTTKLDYGWNYDFHNGYAIASDGEKYGIIDTKGDAVVPFTYEYIKFIDDALLFFELNEECGIMNLMGEVLAVPGTYDYAYDFYKGYSIVDKDEKYGVINSDLELVVPMVYDYLLVNTDADSVEFTALKDNKHGIINSKNEEIMPFEYDAMHELLNASYDMVSERYKKVYSEERRTYAIFDRVTNAPLTDYIYDYVVKFRNGKSIVAIEGKCGIIDESLNVILPLEYWHIFMLDEEKELYACSLPTRRYEVRDGNLDIIAAPECISIYYENELIYAQSYDDYYQGVFDLLGNTVVSFEYGFDGYTACTFNEGVMWVKKDNKWGLIEYMGSGFCDILKKPGEMTEAIEFLNEKGVIAGMNDTEFAPDESITRAQIAALILKMLGKETGNSGANDFTDVSPSDWYYSIASSAKAEGIISGFPDGTFQGNIEIKKEQLIAICARILRNNGFSDETADNTDYSGQISDWVLEDTLLAKSAGIITESGMLNGTENINRGDAAVILKSLYDKIY